MHVLNLITVVVISALFTMGAGIKPLLNTFHLEEVKSIDLIFATGFESRPVASLASETPFNGALPDLETGHQTVGLTPGSFSVDQTGQALYSIPIFTGVGTAGVAPQVSLQYSSASGNGHVGVGWSIAGITLISRCRETAESKDSTGDIIPSPITYGTEDKFCLNGERLFVSNGGVYGADGTEYRTEKEQFARITSIGGAGNNPDSFTVERKDGSISYYGDTTNSNITVTSSDAGINGKTYIWAISRYQDTLNNYIDYDYNKLTNSEFVLTDIDYTGNTTQNLSPYNNISFTYESRNDAYTTYLGGVAFDTSQRLAMIESSIDGTVVRDYTLLYDISSTSSRSILTSVQACRENDCFEPTTFAWSEPNRQFKTTTATNGAFPLDIKSSKLGDANGDARADLVFVDESDNAFKVAYAGGHAGFGLTASTSISAPVGTEIDNKWHLIDYNADGKQDLMKQSGNQWVIYLAQALGFNSTAIQTGLTAGANSDFKIVDLNGDGLADLLYPSAGLSVRYLERVGSTYQFSNNMVQLQLPTDYTQIPGIPAPPSAASYLVYQFYQDDDINFYTTDVNGDGVADLILRADVYYTVFPAAEGEGEEQAYYFLSAGQALAEPTGEPTEEIASSQWVAFVGNGPDGNGKLDYHTDNYFIKSASTSGGDDDEIKFIDINADGLTDVFARNTLNNWQIKLSTGKGFTSFSANISLTNEDHIQFYDHDLDGYLDLVYPSTAADQPYQYRKWNGSTFSGSLFTGANAVNVEQNVNLFLDFDGDGSADHLRIDNMARQKLYPREDTYQRADQIITFTDGLGAKTEVLYRPLTFSSTYKQGNHQTAALNYGLGSPVLDLMGAMYVVRQVDVDTPIEGDEAHQNTIRYRYEGARVQTGGRGFLGFEKVITATPVKAAGDTDAKTLESVTTYRQDFPFNGIAASVEVSQLNDNFYAVDKVPPICTGDDCFPDPCLPGDICDEIPRQSETNLAGSDATLTSMSSTPNQINPTAKSTFPYVATTSLDTFSPEDGRLLKTETQSTTHDLFGNPLVHTVTVKDATGVTLQTNTTTNTYSNITTDGRWLIGLLESSTTVKTRTGQPSISTTSEFDYDYTTGLLIEERQDPTGGAELFLRKRYQYDGFGNITRVYTCAGAFLDSKACESNLPSAASSANPYHIHRYKRTTFDAKGRYVVANYNTQEHKLTEVISRDIYGNPLTAVDVLGQTTTNTYDDFGRLISTRNTLGSWSQSSRQWCDDLSGILACPAGLHAKIRVRKLAAGGSTSYIYMDILAREVATITRTFNAIDDDTTSGDDRYVMNKIWHDQFGRKIKTQGDHFLGATTSNIPTTQTEYDRHNRSTKLIMPDGSEEVMSYDGFTTSYTNDAGQRREETRNALDQLTEVKDFDAAGANPNYQNTMSYVYDSQGALKHINRNANSQGAGSDSNERLIENSHDRRGRKTSADDVDTGFSQLFYNALGEVVETTDAEDNSIKSYYDTLGRAYQVESWDGNTQLTRNIKSYNTTNGLLEVESKLTFADSVNYTQSHGYDAFKRPQTTDISFTDVDGVCHGISCDYQAKVYYDAFSRLKYQQDVSGEAIENHYNSRGFLSHVTDAADDTKEYYRINQTDKFGHVISDRKAGDDKLSATYTYHPTRGWLNAINSAHQSHVYEYDTLGNLGKRSDRFNNQSECFLYDRLNRLTDTYRYNNAAQNCSQTGSHVEHQLTSYDVKGNLISKDGSSYTYLTGNSSTIGASPHQVQSKGTQVFEYDDRGHLIRSTHFRNGQGQLVDRNISYTGFNKIKRIYTGSDSSNPIDESVYRYNNSENRYSRTDTNSDGETSVTHFMGNVEVEYNANGQIAYKRHLGHFAVITETNQSTQETYLFHDHLGSIDVITDSDGDLLQHMSFSAWGERRLPSNWDNIDLTASRSYLSPYTSQGFTGHEMLDAFGIINMGGRIYDAELGKMLQADPLVQDPNTSQSFNRYAYVHNNPLSFTDPTGYFSLRTLVAAVVGLALSFILPHIGFHVFWTGFTIGFTSSLIITGSLKDALRAGLVAGAVAFVGNQFTSTGTADAAKAGAKAAAGGVGDTAAATALEKAAPTTTSASGLAGAFQGVSPFDVATQVVQSLDPKAGAILNFLRGGNVSFTDAKAVGGTIQNLISHYGKFKATEELQRFAEKNGMSLAELNLVLVTMSFVGNKLVGTRFESGNYNGDPNAQGIHGMFDRQDDNRPVIDPLRNRVLNKIAGATFDVVDVVLGFTGLLTASDYDFLGRGNLSQTLSGHSLGTMGVSNLVAHGYLDAGLAHLDAIPFGNIAPSGAEVHLGTRDLVNGFMLGFLFNPGVFSDRVRLGWFQHAIYRYHPQPPK